MSQASALFPSLDTGTPAHSSTPSKLGTSLLDFPDDATLQIWRKPAKGIKPQDGGCVHVSELIPGDGDHVLVCFITMATDDWMTMRHELDIGQRLGLKPMLVGSVDRTHIASGLCGAKDFAGLHGLTNTPNHTMVFSPSLTLMRILGIDYGIRSRNALVLIRNGRVIAKWVSGGDGDKPHDWTTILSLVN